MRILVLNRFGLASVRYALWAPPEAEVVLLTSAGPVDDPAADLAGYTWIQPVESYLDNCQVEYHAEALHRQFGFDHVLAMSEFDLTRAARLRERWGLPGQTLDSAVAYRDKLVMKTRLAAAGVPVADFRAIDDPSQLMDFCAEAGYPVVVKPRRGASSVGVRVIDDEAGLLKFLGPGSPLAGDRPADLLAERFVPGEMFHVDGVVRDGRVIQCWPSATTPCLDLVHGRALLSSMVEPNDPLLGPLVDITTAALTALPTPEVSLFHAEVFRTPDGGLVLNEIGCRVGGGRIRDVVRSAFGVDPIEWYVRAVLGTGRPDLPQVPLRQAGYAKAPLRPGTVTEIPQDCPVPGVVRYQPEVRVGEVIGEPGSSDDCLAILVAAGPTADAVRESLTAALTWCETSLRVAS